MELFPRVVDLGDRFALFVCFVQCPFDRLLVLLTEVKALKLSLVGLIFKCEGQVVQTLAALVHHVEHIEGNALLVFNGNRSETERFFRATDL